jgi:5-methylcytosine-specific restriction endonuclease McrA
VNIVGIMRVCSKCRLSKPLTAFYVDRSRLQGRSYVCVRCRGRSDGHPTKSERITKRVQGYAWCRMCRVWIPVASVTKQGVCRMHQREIDRARYASCERVRFKARQRAHARTRGVLPVPIEGAADKLELFENRCAYCPNIATTWDHLFPVSKGGNTTAHNIVPACRRCNSSKRDKDIWAWLEISRPTIEGWKLDQIAFLLEVCGPEASFK